LSHYICHFMQCEHSSMLLDAFTYDNNKAGPGVRLQECFERQLFLLTLANFIC